MLEWPFKKSTVEITLVQKNQNAYYLILCFYFLKKSIPFLFFFIFVFSWNG